MTHYDWSSGRDAGNVAGSRCSDMVRTRFPEMWDYPWSAQKEGALAELLAAWPEVGPAGPTGPQGPPGDGGPVPGPEGPAGPIGSAGADGVQGPPGADGAAGPQGLAGADGAQGPSGTDGAQGAQGEQGLPGNDGAQGIQGVPGDVGAQGPAGADGPQGIQGVAGADGAAGPEGPQGIQGIAGNDGAQGPQGPTGADGGTMSMADVVNALYPVGALYLSTLATNPGTLLGVGTWAAFGAGRALVGLDTGDPDFDTVEETGGSKTHTLTVTEIPSHSHGLQRFPTTTGGSSGFTADTSMSGTPAAVTLVTQASGGGGAHANIQPYIVVYFWKRTA